MMDLEHKVQPEVQHTALLLYDYYSKKFLKCQSKSVLNLKYSSLYIHYNLFLYKCLYSDKIISVFILDYNGILCSHMHQSEVPLPVSRH